MEKGEDGVVVEKWGRGQELRIDGEDGKVRGRGDWSGEGSEEDDSWKIKKRDRG